MEKEKYLLYDICRPTLGSLYKFYYNPKIIGAENIPTEGAFIIVGNHVNIMDQCNVMIKTKRYIHYMAKKEYFDKQYKEGKFAWFFKGHACIPVDRSIKDNDAVEEAMAVLNKGQVLGLFPEGTRNAVKEDKAKEIYQIVSPEIKMEFKEFYDLIKREKTSQVDFFIDLYNRRVIVRDELINNIFIVDNYLRELVTKQRLSVEDYYEHILLPLKYGAVSMASKTKVPIVPFIITGNYEFRRGNLKVVIGKPFMVEDDLEQANIRLRKEMINLYMFSLQNN